MKILVAGCNGLLGQNLLRTAPPGMELHGLARHESALVPEALSSFHRLDITAADTWDFVRSKVRPDWIVNAAALTDVDACERDPAACAGVNRDAVGRMAASGIRLAQLSTDQVFDGNSGPYGEEDAVNPLNVYGHCKRESETAALSGFPGNLVVRTMWMWGKDGDPKKGFPEFVRANLAAGKPVRAAADQWGTPTRAEDLARAIWALVAGGRSGIYHAVGPDWVNRPQWAHRIAALGGLDGSLVQAVTTPELNLAAPRPLRSGLRCDKLARDTGFRPRGLGE